MFGRQWLGTIVVGMLALGLIAVAPRPATAGLLDGLIGYWNLDEGAGTAANDTQGAVNDNGTFVAGREPSWLGAGGGKFGPALTFTPNQEVRIPNSTDLDIGTDQVSVSLWAKLNDLPSEIGSNYQGIFDSSSDDYVLYLDGYSDELRMKVSNSAGHAARPGIPNASLVKDEWVHVVGTFDGSGAAGVAKIYLNGQLKDTHTGGDGLGGTGLAGLVKPGQIPFIGSSSGSAFYSGDVDDIGVWKRTLTPDEITYLHNDGVGHAIAEPAPVVHLKLDGDATNSGTGGSAYDATLTGGPAYSAGQIGTRSLDMDGAADYASVNYTLPDNGAIAMWYYAQGPWYNYQTLFDNSGNADDWEMWIYNTGLARFRIQSDAYVSYDLDDLGGPNRWYQITTAWQRSGANVDLQLYVNGELRSTDSGSWVNPGSTFHLGGGVNTKGNGAWDDVRIYDQSLAADQVWTLYSAPAVHLKFDGDTKNSGIAGSASDATVNGTTRFVQGYGGGQALDLAGGSEYAAIEYKLPEQGTIAMWYYAEPWYDYQTIFDNSVSANDWEMWIYSSGLLRFRIDSGNQAMVDYDLDNLDGPDNWYHLAVTWDKYDTSGNALQLYIDGVLRDADNIPSWIVPGQFFYLGGGLNAGGNGLWDDVRIYQRVLGAQEIFEMAVPEPTTLSLLAIGALGLLARRRKKH